MRSLRKLEKVRIPDPMFDDDPELAGRFRVPCANVLEFLDVIASVTSGWDHVSVSMPQRCPTWVEMEYVKRLFFRPEETAMQLHPPTAQYIDGSYPGGRARFCLHIWRPQAAIIPLPPRRLVGANSREELSEMMRKDLPLPPHR